MTFLQLVDKAAKAKYGWQTVEPHTEFKIERVPYEESDSCTNREFAPVDASRAKRSRERGETFGGHRRPADGPDESNHAGEPALSPDSSDGRTFAVDRDSSIGADV